MPTRSDAVIEAWQDIHVLGGRVAATYCDLRHWATGCNKVRGAGCRDHEIRGTAARGFGVPRPSGSGNRDVEVQISKVPMRFRAVEWRRGGAVTSRDVWQRGCPAFPAGSSCSSRSHLEFLTFLGRVSWTHTTRESACHYHRSSRFFPQIARLCSKALFPIVR